MPRLRFHIVDVEPVFEGVTPLLRFGLDVENESAEERISRQQETTFRLPVATWKNLMQHHYPNTAWVNLERDVFDELHAFRRKRRLGTWEAVIDHLLRTVREDREAA